MIGINHTVASSLVVFKTNLNLQLVLSERNTKGRFIYTEHWCDQVVEHLQQLPADANKGTLGNFTGTRYTGTLVQGNFRQNMYAADL